MLQRYLLVLIFCVVIREVHGSDLSSPSIKEKADELFLATLFEESIPLYEKLLSELSEKTKEQETVRLRLARAYFFNGQYEKIPPLLIEAKSSEEIYLLGLAYQKMKQYTLAITTLKTYLSLNESVPYRDEAQFELGLAYFYTEKLEMAQHQFEMFFEDFEKKRLFLLSQIYLVRIAIARGKCSQAESDLHILSHHLEPSDDLQYALSFLQGEIFYSQQQWQKAAVHFEHAIPFKNHEKADWYDDVLYNLGWCHLRLSDTAILEKKSHHLNKAENIFLKLIEKSPSDHAYLALGRCYLAQKANKKLENLLSNKALFTTRDSQYRALLLRAEAAPSYEEREHLFHQLTSHSNSDCSDYPNAWYLQGLNALSEGQASDKETTACHLEFALKSFKKAFELSYPANKSLAALAWKYQIQTLLLSDRREAYVESLSLLSELLNTYRDTLFSFLEEPDEIYFLQGLAASYLLKKTEEKIFFNTAENSLTHVINSYPNRSFYSLSLKLLGTLYYNEGHFQKAEEIFLYLIQDNEASANAGEAWYWAACCVENRGENDQKRKQYLKKVFTFYPQSTYADEAYFRYYTYTDYLTGKGEALEHLKGLKTIFPETPYLIHAYYLLGLHAMQHHSLQLAIETFQKAEAIPLSSQEDREKYCDLMIVKYHAMLERGLAYLSLSEESEGAKRQIYLEHAEDIFLRICSDFEHFEHPFTQKNAGLQEKGIFWLAKCYILAKKDEIAEHLFTKMLENYQATKTSRGYYLSRIWYEQGGIAIRHKEHELALDYFRHAEEAGQGNILNTEELLDLWIQQSLCFQALDCQDEAMLLLSKVINHNAVSSQRLKAMYLRAEIYEKQRRHDLAKRQLEATAKKGGEWSVKAKEKLEKYYAFH